MKTMKVKNCMKSPVISIESEKTIKDAAELMHKNKIGSLLIKKGDEYDIITERDVLKAAAEDKLDYNLSRTMEDPLMTIDEESTIGEAAQMMLSKGIRHLIVVNGRKDIVGIVTIRDIVLAVHEAFLSLFDL